MGPDEWAPQIRAVNHVIAAFPVSSSLCQKEKKANIDSTSSCDLRALGCAWHGPTKHLLLLHLSSYEYPLHHLASAPPPIELHASSSYSYSFIAKLSLLLLHLNGAALLDVYLLRLPLASRPPAAEHGVQVLNEAEG